MVQDRAILTMVDREIVSRMWSIKWRHFQQPWTTQTPISRSQPYLMLNISETVRDTNIVSMEY